MCNMSEEQIKAEREKIYNKSFMVLGEIAAQLYVKNQNEYYVKVYDLETLEYMVKKMYFNNDFGDLHIGYDSVCNKFSELNFYKNSWFLERNKRIIAEAFRGYNSEDKETREFYSPYVFVLGEDEEI